jgi:hypothetical protein
MARARVSRFVECVESDALATLAEYVECVESIASEECAVLGCYAECDDFTDDGAVRATNAAEWSASVAWSREER